MSVPKSRMMGTSVTHNGQCGEPTLQTFMLRKVEATGHLLFQGIVVHVLVQLGKRSERGYFKCLPCRRHVWLIVLPEMLCYELIVRATEFGAQVDEIFIEQVSIFCQSVIKEPECTVC